MSCRDIKLENIFIGGDGRVKLGDFGLTMSMKQEVAISPVGTVEYMAPEVSIAQCLSSLFRHAYTSYMTAVHAHRSFVAQTANQGVSAHLSGTRIWHRLMAFVLTQMEGEHQLED